MNDPGDNAGLPPVDPPDPPGAPEAPADRFTPERPEGPAADSGYVPGPLPPVPAAEPQWSPRYRHLLLAACSLFVVWMALWALGGECRALAVAGLESLPFLPLAVLAYLGRRTDWGKALTLVWWAVLVVGSALAVWLFTVSALMTPEALEAAMRQRPVPRGVPIFRTGSLLVAAWTFLGVSLGAWVGLLGFLRPVRRAAARVIPVDPRSFVHATALATVAALTVILFVPLATLGEPPTYRWASLLGRMQQDAGGDPLRGQVYGLLWLIPVAVVAVGYPIERDFRGALRRLGLVRPRLWQLALGVVLVPVFFFATDAVEFVIHKVWTLFGWQTTNGKVFDELIKFAFNPLGAVVIGVTAGLGEETAFRGVLQPRLGIVLSNLLFTSVHALQYNWDGLLSVFLIGLSLGVIRKYTNTTTSAIVHGGYDFALVLVRIVTGSA